MRDTNREAWREWQGPWSLHTETPEEAMETRCGTSLETMEYWTGKVRKAPRPGLECAYTGEAWPWKLD